jgi:hypothetical protein
MYVYLPNMNALCTFNSRGVVLLPIQYALGISKKMTFLFHYYITSRFENLPKLIYSATQVSNFVVFSVRCELINFLFQMFFYFLFFFFNLRYHPCI